MGKKAAIMEFFFNHNKYIGIKYGFGFFTTICFVIFRDFIPKWVISLLLIILILFCIGRLFFYNKWKNEKAAIEDIIVLVVSIILFIVYSFLV